MNSNQNIQNGRSTSRIKNASQSQGFANKNLYGSGIKKQTSVNRPRRKKQSNNGEMSESTIVKVIVGSILAAVILAIVIIIGVAFMDFQI